MLMELMKKRDFHVKEGQSEEMERRRKMDGKPTEALMCHLIPTLRDTKTGGLRSQS
jgi:hypothetical protein